MATKINLIITPTKVYVTYVQTICFEESLDETDENEREQSIMRASSTAFSYASTFKSCVASIINTDTNLTRDEVRNLFI